MFVQMQEQMQNQAKNMFSSFPFKPVTPGVPGQGTPEGGEEEKK
jgi:hypothetical protein